MKNENGRITYEVNDCVQIVFGSDICTLGIVMEVIDDNLTIWGAAPSYFKERAYTIGVKADNVRYIGPGKKRPLRPGEQHTDSNQQHPPPRSRTLRPNPPRFPQQQQQPRPTPPPPPPPEEAAAPQFGAVDVESIQIPRPPANYPEPTPEMLQPAEFHRPSSAEIHELARPKHQPQDNQNPQIQSEGRDDNGPRSPEAGRGNRAPQGVEIPIPHSSIRSRRGQKRDAAPVGDPPVRDGSSSEGVSGDAAEGSPSAV